MLSQPLSTSAAAASDAAVVRNIWRFIVFSIEVSAQLVQISSSQPGAASSVRPRTLRSHSRHGGVAACTARGSRFVMMVIARALPSTG